MYGKIYPELYTGSMFGAGAMAFALWPYIVVHARIDQGSTVELNPKLLAAIFGESTEKIQSAIDYFCQEDPESRSKVENGRRLVRRGQFLYEVVNLGFWRNREDGRVEYWRNYRKRRRKEGKDLRKRVHTKNEQQHIDVKSDTECVHNCSREHSELFTHADADASTTDKSVVQSSNGELWELISKWLRNAQSCGSDYTEEETRKAFLYFEANGWMLGSRPVVDHRAAVERQIQNDRQRAPRRINGSPSIGNMPLGLQADALKRAILEHPANKESVCYSENCTESDKRGLKEMRTKLKDIETNITKGIMNGH